MANTTGDFNGLAPLRNVAAFLGLVKQVRTRQIGMPGMATFYGPSGFGKSSAALYAANAENAVLVQVKSVWTKKHFCAAILADLGVPPGRTVADMVDQISERLASSGAPLLIDEADVLVERNMVEITRDIYESSFAPVILIGEELLPQKLRRWERVHGRMLRWLAAEPVGERDFELLQARLCPGVAIDAALRSLLIEQSEGSIRRIGVNLSLIREQATLSGRTKATADDWQGRELYTGRAPDPRSGYAARSSASQWDNDGAAPTPPRRRR